MVNENATSRGDCLLVYKIDHDLKYVRLIDIGSHAKLFDK